MSNPMKSVKVLTGLVGKKQSEFKEGLIISGSLPPECVDAENNVGLKVTEGVYVEKDLYVADKTYAVGFSQVGVLDVNGLLQVSGHLVTTGSFELSGSSDFLSIDTNRNSEGLYFVDEAIHDLDERIAQTKNKINQNKYTFTKLLSSANTVEEDSPFPWSEVRYISIDIMVYNPPHNGQEEFWSNDLTAIQMKQNSSGNIKFVLTVPTLDGSYGAGALIRVIATRHTDIIF